MTQSTYPMPVLTGQQHERAIEDCKTFIAEIKRKIKNWKRGAYTLEYLNRELLVQQIALAALTTSEVFEIEISGEYWLSCSDGLLEPEPHADFTSWPDGVNKLYPSPPVPLKPEKVSGLDWIDWNEISKRGLLVRINNEIMHPLGLAIFRDEFTGVSGGAVIAPDGIWTYEEDAE